MGTENEPQTIENPFDDVLAAQLGEEAVEEAETSEVPPEPEAEVPVEAPESVEEPVAEVETPQETPQEPETSQAPSAEPQLTEAQLAEQRAQWRAAQLEQLGQQYGQLITADMVADFETNPAGVLAQIMSNSHMMVYESLMEGFQRVIPQTVNQQLAQFRAAQAYESKFFEAWPQLRGVPRDQLDRIADAYRAAKGGTDVGDEDSIKEVGALAHTILKIPVDVPKATEMKTEPKKAPWKPAAPGGAAPPVQKDSGDDNEYTQMVNELLDSGRFHAPVPGG